MRRLGLLLFAAICVAKKFNSEKFVDQIVEKSDLLNSKKDPKYESKKKSFKSTAVENFQKLGDEKYSAAINDVGEGLIQFAGGISNGNWQDMLLGGLSIVGTLASFAGPIGAAISTVLSVVSMVFGLFGGTQEAQESQEGMLKRVIEEALEVAHANELRAEAEGLKKAVSSIRNSINQFREENKTTESQATELYNQAFRGLTFIGQLKFYIDKFCNCSVQYSNKKADLSTARKNSEKCLEFLNLYTDLSILRLLLIADMASLFGSVQKGSTATNLLSLTEKEKVSDREVFQFLLDPVNNVNRRFCIAQYYGAPGKYQTLRAYLASLISSPSAGNFFTKQVVICSEKELLGLCYKLEPKNHSSQDLSDWSGEIKSLYVSDKLEVTGFIDENNSGTFYGPFPGATVIGKIPGIWKSLNISPLTKKTKHVRVCEKESLIQEEICYEFPINSTIDLQDIYGKEPKTSISFSSMYIPENTGVSLFKNKNDAEPAYGPFYGPNTINDVCKGTVNFMRIFETNKNPSEMVKICRGEYFSGACVFAETKDYGQMIFGGCHFDTENNPIKSMFVPGGFAVYMWTGENYIGKPFGPYVGPVSVPVVDRNSDNNIIKSLKIVKLNPRSNNSSKKKHRKSKNRNASK